MQLHQFNNVEEFWQKTENYLLQYEAEHNAILGVLQTLLRHPERYPQPPYLAIVETKAEILALAIRTPPNYLLVSKAQDVAALHIIAEDLYTLPLSGVSGLVTEVLAFVEAWHRLTDQPYQREVESRLYQLTQVAPVALVTGYLRLATESDRPLLLEWFADFYAGLDTLVEGEIERRVEVELKRQSTYLWEDNQPVSMASGRKFSSTSARIAPVYTPSEFRRKGYATSCVAALSQTLLEQGCDRCFLFTDLANPISNSIYQKIGYRSVCDWYEYSFNLKESP